MHAIQNLICFNSSDVESVPREIKLKNKEEEEEEEEEIKMDQFHQF